MSKVLSTKLAVDEVDRFSAAAEQQGLSKACFLKNLVEEYLGDSNEENETSSNNKLGNSSSLKKRQTPEEGNRGSLQLETQEVLPNEKLEKSLNRVHLTGRIQNGAQRVAPDRTPVCISCASINSQGKASLAKVPDSKKAITKEPSIEQGLLKVKTQARSKTGFGELLFFGLIALGIVSALKRNSNQKILPELNCDSYTDYNEDIAAVYRDMGLPYP